MMLQTSLWNWSSPIWLIAITVAIIFRWQFQLGVRQAVSLTIGLALLVLAYVSPIGILANGYLFSAHMIQHLLLLLVVPLCFLLSLPSSASQPYQDRVPSVTTNPSGRSRRIGPATCWVAGVGAMWFWHVPTFCSAAAQNTALGATRDLTFIVAGLLFWWPIYGNRDQSRLPALAGVTYLFSACFACTLLGIYITFTPLTVCPVFANPVDRLGIINQLYNVGMTPRVDQNLGGLLMWVPPCTLYVVAIISLLCRWYAEFPSEPLSAPPSVQPGPT